MCSWVMIASPVWMVGGLTAPAAPEILGFLIGHVVPLFLHHALTGSDAGLVRFLLALRIGIQFQAGKESFEKLLAAFAP